MKPIRLEIEGMTCYREKQVIDFSKLELFAITGPTGSGKSTLLDTMTFALYGRIPRVGTGHKSMVSSGKKRGTVIFDFSVGRKKFRVTRVSRPNGAAEAQLEEIFENGDRKPLAENMNPVSELIAAQIVGLGYEAFKKAVLLPQNEFSTFLKSDPREQREIVKQLLNLQIFERMAKMAKTRAAAAESEFAVIEARRSALAGSTPEALALSRGELERSEIELERSNAEIPALENETSELRRKLALVESVRALERALAQKESAAVGLDEKRGALDRARRAESVLPAMEAEEMARNAREEARAALEASETKLIDAIEAAKKADRSHEVATRNADQITELEMRRAWIEGLEPKIAQLRDEIARKTAENTERSNVEAKLAKSSAELNRIRAQLADTRSNRDLLDRQLAELAFDPGRLLALDASREPCSKLTSLDSDLKSSNEDVAKKREALRATTQAKNSAKESLARANAAEESAQKKLETAVAALTLARRDHAAAHLRQGLNVGQACPVCEHTIEEVPKHLEAPALAAAEKAEASARKSWEAKRTEREAAANTASVREAQAQAAAELLASVEETALKKQRERDDAWTELQSLVTSLGLDAERPLASLSDALRVAKLDQTRDSELRRQRSNADADVTLLEHKESMSERERQEWTERLSEVVQRIASLDTRIATLTAEIGAAKPSEKTEIQGRIQSLRSAVEQARATLERSKANLDAARANQAELFERAREREKAHETRQELLGAALAAGGFTNTAEAKLARLDPGRTAALDASIQQLERDLHACRSQLAAEREKLGNGVATREELNAAESRLADARRIREGALERAALSRARVQRLEADLAQLTVLENERSRIAHVLRTYRTLGDDLSSNHIPEFVLAESFTDLVKGASERLFHMSRRYGLEYDPKERFSVIDYDQADARRSTDTLSGGEIFLASLALATELSAQVQTQAGAVLLESLFIDEGFGALDAESLELVAEAIETLPTGGRMVGIVTHVPELAARLPARLEVEKGKSGSSVRISEN